MVPEQRLIVGPLSEQFLLDSPVFLLVFPQGLELALEGSDDGVLLVHAGGEVLGGEAEGGLACFSEETHVLIFEN